MAEAPPRTLEVAPDRLLQIARRRQARKSLRGAGDAAGDRKYVSIRPVIRTVNSAPATLQGAQLVRILSDMQLTNSWYALVPSMLGESDTPQADAAAKAVIQAYSVARLPDRATRVGRPSAAYVAAIKALRDSLDSSDTSLVAVGLLELYEVIRKDEPGAFFSHADGMRSIMLSRAGQGPPSSIMRAAFHGNTYATFQQPLENGTASTFDEPYWLDVEPIALQSLSTETLRLRRLSNQILIQVPGLIAKVRVLREQAATGMPDTDLLRTVTDLAEQMLELKDDEAENTLLHRVSVKPTIDPFDKIIVPYSFVTDAYYEKETLLVYWGGRLMVLRLCLVLDDMTHTYSQPGSSSTSSSATCEAPFLEKEQERMVISTLMFWQEGFGQANIFSMVWGALMGKHEFRGKPINGIRNWVWRRYHDALAGWPIQRSMADLDDEADVLAGGPLTPEPWRDIVPEAVDKWSPSTDDG